MFQNRLIIFIYLNQHKSGWIINLLNDIKSDSIPASLTLFSGIFDTRVFERLNDNLPQQ